MEPSLKRYGGKRLPEEVCEVMKSIQKLMTDEHQKNDRRPKTLPSMPRQFFYSEVTKAEDKNKMIDFAFKNQGRYSCYEVFVPFRCKRRLWKSRERYIWSENLISFSSISEEKPFKELMVIEVVEYPRTRRGRTKRFKSKSLINFDNSKLVGCYSGRNLVSGHHMTISWLRSRLHKAINKYLKEKQSDFEVIPIIKQKKEGPLFLSLHVEKKIFEKDSAEIKSKYDVLFTLSPAFQVSSCYLIVPIITYFDEIPSDLGEAAEEYLWKRIIKCRSQASDHQHNERGIVKEGVLKMEKLPVKRHTSRPVSNEPAERKDVKRDLTPSQRQKCQECCNPASRMLLEYYYQYGNIPEEEMTQANSFVERILGFIKRSIKIDRKTNDPNVLEFVKSGSVPEKLKVVLPDEFDVMVRIGLPESKINYRFYSDDGFPTGYAICAVSQTGTVSHSLKRCLVNVDGYDFEHCLNPEKLAFGWLYGMLERAINKYKNPSNSPEAVLKIKRGGPALMLEITPNRSTTDTFNLPLPDEIKVDLVLALEQSSSDSRLYVPKRAQLEHFYKKKLKKMKDEQPRSDGTRKAPIAEEKKTTEEKTENAKKNLQYMWRISYSAKEKLYLECVADKQRSCGVEGCQNICLMILKTICARESLKHRQSVICHKLSSYILKTALFHVLKQTDLIQDWKIDSLADRFVDLLNKVSKLDEELPHFFFNNEAYLAEFFRVDNDWCKAEKVSINLLDNLTSTLKMQLLKRLSRIAKSFKNWKEEMDKKWKDSSETINDQVYQEILGGKCPEVIIHPSVNINGKSEELPGDDDTKETEKKLKGNQRDDEQVREAAKNERRSGNQLDSGLNLRRVRENQEDNRSRKRRHEEIDNEGYLFGSLREWSRDGIEDDSFDVESGNSDVESVISDTDGQQGTSEEEEQGTSDDEFGLDYVEEDEDDNDIYQPEIYYDDGF